ncbi:form3 [Trypoxylus dichotomus]
MVQSNINSKIAVLRCDNGSEYIISELKNSCRDNGTFIDYPTPYAPQQNGKAERYNRSLVNKARAMIQEANLPKMFWSEAIRVAAYILNRSPQNNKE